MRKAQFLLVWNGVALSKSALTSLTCVMLACSELQRRPQNSGVSPYDTPCLWASLPPSKASLEPCSRLCKKDWAYLEKCAAGVWWKVGRKWLRAPDELRQMFGEREGVGTCRWALAPLRAGVPKCWSQPFFASVGRKILQDVALK